MFFACLCAYFTNDLQQWSALHFTSWQTLDQRNGPVHRPSICLCWLCVGRRHRLSASHLAQFVKWCCCSSVRQTTDGLTVWSVCRPSVSSSNACVCLYVCVCVCTRRAVMPQRQMPLNSSRSSWRRCRCRRRLRSWLFLIAERNHFSCHFFCFAFILLISLQTGYKHFIIKFVAGGES